MGRQQRSAIIAAWLAAVCLTFDAPVAYSKPIPLTLGAQATYRTIHEFRLSGYAQWAINDAVALRVQGGPALLAGRAAATALGGPVLSLDVLTWVPSIYVMGGVRGPSIRPLVQVGAELKRYVSLHTGVSLGLCGEWAGTGRFGGAVAVGGAWSF